MSVYLLKNISQNINQSTSVVVGAFPLIKWLHFEKNRPGVRVSIGGQKFRPNDKR